MAKQPAISDVVARAIRDAARKQLSKQVRWRRHRHQYPELSGKEIETTRFLKRELKELGFQILPIRMKTGILAELKGRRAGKTIAVRSDIDALPILEKTGLPFASRNGSCMHACGHDIHMATVLGAGALLAERRDSLTGSVRLIFQPSEEQPPGGARPMIDNGALENVSLIFGLHVDPELATGKFGLRDGPAMGSVYDFDLVIRGTGGHAARPHLSVDAITVAAEVIESLQKVISRETDPVSPVVITFGTIEGGAARNVIAPEVRLAGTARTLSPAEFKRVPRLIKRTLAGVCKARGATFELTAKADYPVLRNSPLVNRVLAQNATALFGARCLTETPQVLGGEDFACYLEKVPGAMFRLGTMNRKLKTDRPWHAPDFNADEAAMPYGSALLAVSVLNTLGAA
jgi:amidohydrolase